METYNNTIKKLLSNNKLKPQESADNFPNEAFDKWVCFQNGQILLASFIFGKSPEEIIEDMEEEDLKQMRAK